MVNYVFLICCNQIRASSVMCSRGVDEEFKEGILDN
jgi:hypothetical protein